MFKIAAIKHSLVEHKKLTKDAVFKKYGKIVDVANKLTMDAVFGNNLKAFPESDDEDEYSDSDGDNEYSDSGFDSSNNIDDVSETVIDRRLHRRILSV
jgi:hypothetical protein